MALRRSGIDDGFKGMWLGTVKPLNSEQAEYVEKLKDVVMQGRHWCLVVGGTKGNGKSYLSQIAVNTYNNDSDNAGFAGALYITQPLLEAALRTDGSNAFLKYSSAPVLVLDELSDRPEDWTDYIKTNIENIIVEIHRRNNALVAIGNIDLKRLVRMFELRIRDRLKEGLLMTMKEESLRKEGGR